MQQAIALRLAGHPQRQRLRGGLCQRRRQAGVQPDQIGVDADALARRLQINLAVPYGLPRQALAPPRAKPGHYARSGGAPLRQNLHLAITGDGVDAQRAADKLRSKVFPIQAVTGEIDVAVHLFQPRQAGCKQGIAQKRQPAGQRGVVAVVQRHLQFQGEFHWPTAIQRIGETAQPLANRAEVGEANEILNGAIGLAVDMQLLFVMQ